MTIEELVAHLRELEELNDEEKSHVRADRLLLEYINNDEVTLAFNSLTKWYA